MQDADRWHEQVKVVMSRLNEQQRRWVAGLLSAVAGGDTQAAYFTGLDPKTIKRGREELDDGLQGCPRDRIRREGAGRPCAEKKTPLSKRS